jgi:FkbM family methyltransferase
LKCPYLHRRFVTKIDKTRVRTIFECGSRDGLDAIELNKYYKPESIYAFECNPEAIELCKKNLKDTNIVLVEKAVYNESKIVDFYAADMEKSIDKNLGASSLLWHRDNEVEFFQKKIQVEAIRLDDFMKQNKINKVDMLCMDLQGVELQALQGLGNKLKDVIYIILEVSLEHYYKDDVLFKQMKGFLDDKGFQFRIGSGLISNRVDGFTNCLFMNKSL